MTALENPVFTKVYSFTDTLTMEIEMSLHYELIRLTEGFAREAGITGGLWPIITPVSEGYRVELFEEDE